MTVFKEPPSNEMKKQWYRVSLKKGSCQHSEKTAYEVRGSVQTPQLRRADVL